MFNVSLLALLFYNDQKHYFLQCRKKISLGIPRCTYLYSDYPTIHIHTHSHTTEPCVVKAYFFPNKYISNF